MAIISRLYNFVAGTPAVADEVDAEFDQLVATVNSIDAANLAPAVAVILGLNQAGAVARGKSIVATEESRTNASYGLLTTPDRVSSVVMPTDGLFLVSYSALWKNSVASAGRAAFFLGSNQAKVDSGADAGVALEAAAGSSSADTYGRLGSFSGGLAGHVSTGASTDVTTGQILGLPPTTGAKVNLADVDPYTLGVGVGGWCLIEAAAGTYDVTVQFKSASGSVTVKNRHLRVLALGF